MGSIIETVTRDVEFVTIRATNITLAINIKNIIYVSLVPDSTKLIVACMQESITFQFASSAGAADVFARLNTLLNATMIRAVDAKVINPSTKILG